MAITMDNVTYNVGIEYESLSRSFTIIEGDNEGTNLEGRAIRDILGTGYTYEMTVHPIPGSETDYDNFFYAVSAPREYHTITFPFGQSTITFQAKITEGNDTFGGYYGGRQNWKGLELTFEYMAPYRT